MTTTPEQTAPTAAARPANAITHSCGAWWTGATRAHCPACHEVFSCESAADRHRVGAFGVDRRCADPASVGLVARVRPYGVLWGHPGPDEGATERRAANWA